MPAGIGALHVLTAVVVMYPVTLVSAMEEIPVVGVTQRWNVFQELHLVLLVLLVKTGNILHVLTQPVLWQQIAEHVCL